MNNIVQTHHDVQTELTAEQQERINDYAQKGNEEIDNENYEHAIGWFSKALEFVPEPKDKWEATGWLCASIGDACFNVQDYDIGLANLHRAYNVYGPDEENPFVLLRLGQCYFHLGDCERAEMYLYQAYLLEGSDMFEDETLYFDFLKSRHDIQTK